MQRAAQGVPRKFVINVIQSLRGLEREPLEVVPLGVAPGGPLQKVGKPSDVACGPRAAVQIYGQCDPEPLVLPKGTFLRPPRGPFGPKPLPQRFSGLRR